MVILPSKEEDVPSKAIEMLMAVISSTLKSFDRSPIAQILDLPSINLPPPSATRMILRADLSLPQIPQVEVGNDLISHGIYSPGKSHEGVAVKFAPARASAFHTYVRN